MKRKADVKKLDALIADVEAGKFKRPCGLPRYSLLWEVIEEIGFDESVRERSGGALFRGEIECAKFLRELRSSILAGG